MDEVLIGEKYAVELIDDGTLDTVIKVDGKEIRYTSDSEIVHRNEKGEIINWGEVVKTSVEIYQELYENK